jgi:hypothetical protein
MILIVLRNFRSQPTDEGLSPGEKQHAASRLRNCKDSLGECRKLLAEVDLRQAPGV